VPLKKRPNIAAQISAIRQGEKDGVKKILDDVKERHEKIVSPWEVASDKPSFSVVIEESKSEITGGVMMSATAAVKNPYSVWQLLNYGTEVRYMQLSPEWVSKTRPRSLSSGAGDGRKLGIDLEKPWRGIDKREWDIAVAEAVEADARKSIMSGAALGLKRAFG
jgi:hypothetical protein